MAETGKRALQARETKRAIFKCALDLFAEHPYEQVSVKDICDAAGVSVGAFYHHFEGKDNLLDEGYRVFDQQLEQDWDARQTAGALEDIHFLIDHQMRSMEAMGGFAAAQYFKNQLSVDHSYMLDAHRVLNVKLIESLRRSIGDGVLAGDPDTIAEEILCVTRGIIYDWNLHGHDYDLVTRGRHLVDILLEHYRVG
ncbi:TetR/AcrR family transcriptional regulator [Collinsella tanakaei]|uniref:TetR/AcrR family transcriptional regulator n=1 Tax=Collinsella tanakaei TaxID=626935 RepID=UPI0025A3EB3B|nr:TetR/AcrR family transcriptional regulator [Collinsella tanakaei]MDM8301736.1 TetR/AcrR family transcriptional regulator [Collinsella tanakaei]